MKRVIGIGITAAAALCVSPARAWYFPEHTELTRLALQDFAPSFATAALDMVVHEIRRDGLGVALDEDVCNEPQLRASAPPYPALCEGVSTKLSTTGTIGNGACVPYGALAALAGDHANTACGLLSTLVSHGDREPRPYRFGSGSVPTRPVRSTPLAVILTEAARATWDDFRDSAPPELVRNLTREVARLAPSQGSNYADNPRDYVRQLDVALFILDPAYTSRAKGAKTHFHDATSSLDGMLDQAAQGDVDNALAQLAAHHLRSLQLAYLARSAKGPRRTALRAAALMEHAFALHFMEDGLAAGHVATDPAVTVDEKRAQRHDHFNRQGLAVTRALAKRPCNTLEEPFDDTSMGLHPCWVAHGDGFATGEDRRYVSEAAARLQTSFALALQPLGVPGRLPSVQEWVDRQRGLTACKEWIAGNGKPKNGCDLAWAAFLLDPWPEWTTEVEHAPEFVPWAQGILRRHEAALADLSRLPLLREADAGSPEIQRNVFPANFIDGAFANATDAPVDLYDPGMALLRPFLVAWPAARTDVTTLVGGDKFHRGLQLQVAVAAALSGSRPLQTGSTMATWFGIGGGIGYATEGIFPARVNRTLFEANGGFAQGVFLAGEKERFRTIAVAEARAPVTSLLMYGTAYLFRTRKPLALLGESFSWGLLGGRGYWVLRTPKPRLVGWDAEVANLYLGTPGSLDAAASGIMASELRFRLGVRSLDFSTLTSPFSGALFVAAELTSGYYTTVF